MKKIYDRLLILSIAFGIILTAFAVCSFQQLMDTLNAENVVQNNKFCIYGGGESKNANRAYTGGFSLNSAFEIEKAAHKKSIKIAMQSSLWCSNISLTEKKIFPANAVMTDYNFPKVTASKLTSGRFFNKKEFDKFKFVCIISQELKSILGNRKSIFIEGRKFKIIGALKVNKNLVKASKVIPNAFLTNTSYDTAIFVPATTVSKYLIYRKTRNYKDTLYSYSGMYTFVINNTQNYSSGMLKDILSPYIKYVGNKPSITGYRACEIGNFKILQTLLQSKLIFLTAFIALILSIISMIYISSAKIYDNQREIGIKLALGAKRKSIIVETAYNIFFCSIKGTYIGVVMSSVICTAYNIITGRFIYSFNFLTVLIAFIISTIVTLITSIIPAYRASRIEPAIVLKGE